MNDDEIQGHFDKISDEFYTIQETLTRIDGQIQDIYKHLNGLEEANNRRNQNEV